MLYVPDIGVNREEPTLKVVSSHGLIVFPVGEKDGDVIDIDDDIESELVPGFSIVRLAFWSFCSGIVKSVLFATAVEVATWANDHIRGLKGSE